MLQIRHNATNKKTMLQMEEKLQQIKNQCCK